MLDGCLCCYVVFMWLRGSCDSQLLIEVHPADLYLQSECLWPLGAVAVGPKP